MRPPCPPRRRLLARGAAVLTGFLLAAFALASPAGCTDDVVTTPDTADSSDPRILSIEIGSPCLKDGKPTGVIAIGEDPDAHIQVSITFQGLTVRPPGVCGAAANCGHLVLRVNGVENNIGGSSTVDVLVRKLANRYAELTITAEIVDGSGAVLINNSAETGVGFPVSASVTVTTKVSCDEDAGSSSSGAGGAGGGGTGGAGGNGAGGAGGTGGAGGAGGAGGTGGV